MVLPSPVVAALVNGQKDPCLIDRDSEVAVMENDFYAQRLGHKTKSGPLLAIPQSGQQFVKPGQRSHLGEDID